MYTLIVVASFFTIFPLCVLVVHYITLNLKLKKMPKHFRHFTTTITVQKLWKRRQK